MILRWMCKWTSWLATLIFVYLIIVLCAWFQIEGEGEEEAEERRWNKRSQQMLHVLNRVLQRQPTVGFKEMAAHNNRKQVASKFYTFLVLKKLQAIGVEQTEPYGDITISKGPAFSSVCWDWLAITQIERHLRQRYDDQPLIDERSVQAS